MNLFSGGGKHGESLSNEEQVYVHITQQVFMPSNTTRATRDLFIKVGTTGCRRNPTPSSNTITRRKTQEELEQGKTILQLWRGIQALELYMYINSCQNLFRAMPTLIRYLPKSQRISFEFWEHPQLQIHKARVDEGVRVLGHQLQPMINYIWPVGWLPMRPRKREWARPCSLSGFRLCGV